MLQWSEEMLSFFLRRGPSLDFEFKDNLFSNVAWCKLTKTNLCLRICQCLKCGFPCGLHEILNLIAK